MVRESKRWTEFSLTRGMIDLYKYSLPSGFQCFALEFRAAPPSKHNTSLTGTGQWPFVVVTMDHQNDGLEVVRWPGRRLQSRALLSDWEDINRLGGGVMCLLAASPSSNACACWTLHDWYLRSCKAAYLWAPINNTRSNNDVRGATYQSQNKDSFRAYNVLILTATHSSSPQIIPITFIQTVVHLLASYTVNTFLFWRCSLQYDLYKAGHFYSCQWRSN